MHRAIALGLALAVGISPLPAIEPVPPAPPKPFELTVDSIMRGPRLVGHPPEELRWSGDSRELFFEWRMGNEDEAATWVVIPGQRPRRLSDDERRRAPAGLLSPDDRHAFLLVADSSSSTVRVTGATG